MVLAIAVVAGGGVLLVGTLAASQQPSGGHGPDALIVFDGEGNSFLRRFG